MPPVAFSYIRFSTKEQRKGHSVERQDGRARDWADRHGVPLDTSRTWHDLGKSAYLGDHRKNPDRCALAAFLRLVEEGGVPRGSYLIIEALDRLTREHVRAGLSLCLSLIESGIRIVQLSPSEVIYDEASDAMALMLMVVELSRGHGESKRKSELIGPAWRKKKERAREGVILTRRLPAWVTIKGGKLALVPGAAAAIREAAHLAAHGYGLVSIIRKFERDGVKPFGVSGRWKQSYLQDILSDRRVIGELQPMRRSGEPDGPVIPDYYPPAINEAEFLAARAGMAERMTFRGRTSGRGVNIFAGLLRNARDGGSYYMTRHTSRWADRPSRTYAQLINSGAVDGAGRAYTIQYEVFEAAFLSLLREANPSEVLGGAEGPDDAQVIAGELAGVDAELAAASAHMEENGFSPTIGRHVDSLEARKRGLVERLSEAKRKAASPLSASWGEAQTFAEALESAPDPRDARLRLRSVLRRIVESMHLLVVPRGRSRLAALQVRFAGGHRRDYLILTTLAYNNGRVSRPASWHARSLTGGPPLDLADPAHAAALAARLEALDLSSLRGDR